VGSPLQEALGRGSLFVFAERDLRLVYLYTAIGGVAAGLYKEDWESGSGELNEGMSTSLER